MWRTHSCVPCRDSSRHFSPGQTKRHLEWRGTQERAMSPSFCCRKHFEGLMSFGRTARHLAKGSQAANQASARLPTRHARVRAPHRYTEGRVNKRPITWLLAALLAILAHTTVPVVRPRAANSNSAIVWISRDRAEQRILIPARAAAPHVQSALLVSYQPPAKARHFAASLYQRPPPSLR